MSVQIMPTEQHHFYVTFELRPVEDRESSIATGMPSFKDVEFAVITMPGGGLVVDKEITPELLSEWKHGKNRKPPSPFALAEYNAWKEGREAPVQGTALSNWPGVTPAQLKMCLALTVRTVENLANADEDTLRRLGMGSRALKDKARAYLAAAETNKGSEALSAMMVKMEAMQETIDKQAAKLAALEDGGDETAEPTKRKPGRPRKE